MLQLQNISKSYGEKEVLRDINITFLPGKITVIVGPSGEGKSTIFRLITALTTPNQGKIIRSDDASIGMVFQNNALYPHYDVLNNLVIPQRVVLKRSKAVSIQKAEEILETLNILDLKNKPISTLSGGEAQRVAIARSLVMDNNILLFDEPTSALDYENTRNLVQLLQSLKQNRTIVIITHDTLFAEEVQDEIYQLKNGILEKRNQAK